MEALAVILEGPGSNVAGGEVFRCGISVEMAEKRLCPSLSGAVRHVLGWGTCRYTPFSWALQWHSVGSACTSDCFAGARFVSSEPQDYIPSASLGPCSYIQGMCARICVWGGGGGETLPACVCLYKFMSVINIYGGPVCLSGKHTSPLGGGSFSGCRLTGRSVCTRCFVCWSVVEVSMMIATQYSPY
jgi:hypothetical protein